MGKKVEKLLEIVGFLGMEIKKEPETTFLIGSKSFRDFN